MESFSRVDIFDTKGIEYIFVIGYLVILIIFWKVVNKQFKITKGIQKVIRILSPNILRIPQGLYYNHTHAWIHLDESGIASVGLDDFLLHVTGEVAFTNLRDESELIKKGDLLTELVQNGKRLRIYSPISGIIIKMNDLLQENPGLINEDPFENGWIYKIKPSNWIAETSTCYVAEEATNWTKKEFERLKDFISSGPMRKFSTEPAMVVLQDGGELRDRILSGLPLEVWEDFQKEFLNSNH